MDNITLYSRVTSISSCSVTLYCRLNDMERWLKTNCRPAMFRVAYMLACFLPSSLMRVGDHFMYKRSTLLSVSRQHSATVLFAQSLTSSPSWFAL